MEQGENVEERKNFIHGPKIGFLALNIFVDLFDVNVSFAIFCN